MEHPSTVDFVNSYWLLKLVQQKCRSDMFQMRISVSYLRKKNIGNHPEMNNFVKWILMSVT